MTAGLRWNLAHGRSVCLDRPAVMAIVNVTPDSFADGGRHLAVADAVGAVMRAVRDGAAIIDIGGESTRPGADAVPEAEQIARVVPVIQACRSAGGDLAEIPMSVDTTRAGVARAALEAGADAVNDVSGGTDDPGMVPLVAAAACGLVIMHRRVAPRGDTFSDRYQREPEYEGGVVAFVQRWLLERRRVAMRAGVDASRIVLDPGLGFGKSVEQNLALIEATEALAAHAPVVSALSRKSFVGRVSLGRDSTPEERLPGTLALSARHLARGARVFRVHDVAEHVAALGAAWGGTAG